MAIRGGSRDAADLCLPRTPSRCHHLLCAIGVSEDELCQDATTVRIRIFADVQVARGLVERRHPHYGKDGAVLQVVRRYINRGVRCVQEGVVVLQHVGLCCLKER